MSETADLICGAVAAACHCVLPPDHEGPHQRKPHCGGSWSGDIDRPETFEIFSFPSGVPE